MQSILPRATLVAVGMVALVEVLTMPAADTDPSGDTPALTFRRYDDHYRLGDAWESGNQGREIAAREYARVGRRDC